jgi:hypothetical protein
MFPSKGHESTFWKSIRKRIIEGHSGSTTLGYEREQTKDGKFPTIESYFTYLYIRDVLNLSVSPPGKFRNAAAFYSHLTQCANQNDLGAEIDALKKRKLLVSMAPSACQAEASRKGFHIFDFVFANGVLAKIHSFIYELKAGAFQLAGTSTYLIK